MFEVSDEVKQMKKTTRNFVNSVLIPLEPEIARNPNPREDIFEKMRDLGLYGLTIPQEYGGLGLNTLEYCLLLEELGRGPKPYMHGILLANGIGSRQILIAGTEEQKRKYIPDIAKGKKVCAFALTEPNAGSDVAAIQTFARKEGNYFIFNGAKHFITNGGKADILIVMALTDKEKRARGGITAFIVEKGIPGFTVGQLQETMAGPPVVQAELVFEECKIPVENVIGEVGSGFYTTMQTLDKGRVELGAFALGVAARLLEMSIEYARQRVQFGKPIGEQQGIQFMLAEMATDLYAARSMVYDAAWRIIQGEKLPAQAAMVKLFATEMVNKVADKAVQIFGGMGYMRELPVERMYREVRLMRIAEGTSEIQKIIIAKNLLKEKG